MSDADRFHDLDCIATALRGAIATLETFDPKNSSDDIAAEIDRLSDRIAEVEKERDGTPLDAVLAEQAKEERRDRAWFERGLV